MNQPLGYNPLEGPPGLPKVPKGPPGHVPGPSFANIGGDEANPKNGGFNRGYTGPGIPIGAAKWLLRPMFFIWVYLTAPIEAALYPMAGVVAVIGAVFGYTLARITGGGHDTMMEWGWTGCFLGILAMMRVETSLEDKIAGYKSLRTALRLCVGGLGFFWFCVANQGDSKSQALVIAAIFTVMLFFVLRSKYLRFVWHTLQYVSWMRASQER